MAQKVRLKRSAVASKVPLTTDLDLGELAVNTFDGKLYMKKNNGTESVVEIGAGGGGGGASVTVATTAPSSPSAGDLWWSSDEGKLKIYYIINHDKSINYKIYNMNKELSKIQQVGEKNVVDAQNGLKEFCWKMFQMSLVHGRPLYICTNKTHNKWKNAVIA
jgi:hypothetical protein